jgi:hypothetical protein
VGVRRERAERRQAEPRFALAEPGIELDPEGPHGHGRLREEGHPRPRPDQADGCGGAEQEGDPGPPPWVLVH